MGLVQTEKRAEAHREVVEDEGKGKGIQNQAKLNHQLERDEASQGKENAESSKGHVAINEARALRSTLLITLYHTCC